MASATSSAQVGSSSAASSPTESLDRLVAADSSASTDDDIASSASSSTTPPPITVTPHDQHYQHTPQHSIHTAASMLSIASQPAAQQLHSPYRAYGHPLPTALATPYPARPLSGAFDAASNMPAHSPIQPPPGLDGVMRDLSSLSISPSQPPQQPAAYQHPQPVYQSPQHLLALQHYALQQQRYMQQLAAAAYLYDLQLQYSQHAALLTPPQQPSHAHITLPPAHQHGLSSAHYAASYPHLGDAHIQHLLASQHLYPSMPIPPYLSSSASAPTIVSLSPLSPALPSSHSPLFSAASSSSSLSPPFPRTKLIVRYLPPLLGPAAFHSLFAPFGRLLSSNLIMSRSQPQASLCYGFLLYAAEAEARECRRHMNGRRIDGRVIEVEECKGSKEGRNGEKRVIRITGWKGRPSEDGVRQRVEVYGEVESVAVTCEGSDSGGDGGEASVVVKFGQSASAYRCIEAMHDAHIDAASGGGGGGGAAAGSTGGSVSVKFHDAAHRGRQPHRQQSAGRGGRGSAAAAGGRGRGARQRPAAQHAPEEQWMGGSPHKLSMDGAEAQYQVHAWSAPPAGPDSSAQLYQQPPQQQQQGVVDAAGGLQAVDFHSQSGSPGLEG